MAEASTAEASMAEASTVVTDERGLRRVRPCQPIPVACHHHLTMAISPRERHPGSRTRLANHEPWFFSFATRSPAK